MISDSPNTLPDSWTIERRRDGALLVRIPSRIDQTPRLPDAVFTFRAGDPQFDFWKRELTRQEAAGSQN